MDFPHSLHAEQTLLGYILLMKDPLIMAKTLEVIDSTMFYDQMHKRIFLAMVNVYKKGQALDLTLVSDELQDLDWLNSITHERLIQLTQDATYGTAFENYAKIIKEKSDLRLIMKSCDKIKKVCSEEKIEVQDILDQMQKNAFDISHANTGGSIVKLRDIVKPELDELNRLICTDKNTSGVPSGFAPLDRLIDGFHPGDMVIVAANTSHGKSAFALNIAYNAVNVGNNVALFSLEMTRAQLFRRLLSMESQLKSYMLRKGDSHLKAEWKKLVMAGDKIMGLPGEMFINDKNRNLTPSRLLSKMHLILAQKPNTKLFIIDYFQKMKPDTWIAEETQRDRSIVGDLKDLALELDVAILVVWQFSKGFQKADRAPTLGDLYGTSAGSQEADTIILMDKTYPNGDDGSKPALVEFNVAKARNDRTGKFSLEFFEDFQCFMEPPVF